MLNRVSKYPGRVSLKNVTTGESTVYDMTLADEPTQQGTDYSKAAVLKDATAGQFGLGGTALPDQVFAKLGAAVLHDGNTLYDTLNNKLGEMLYVETGSYVGTGQYVTSYVGTVSMSFAIKPLLVLIYTQNGIGTTAGNCVGAGLLMGGGQSGQTWYGPNVITYADTPYAVNTTWTNDGKTVSWSYTVGISGVITPYVVLDDSGTTYYYIAIGTNPDDEPVNPPVPAMTAREAFERSLAAFVQKSASGATVNITDGADNIPVKSLVTNITPTQAGSGTPTPSNPRTISGYTEANITVTGDDDSETYTVDWSSEGTKYKGTLDVTTGVLTVTHAYLLLDGSFGAQQEATGATIDYYRNLFSASTYPKAVQWGDILSDKFTEGDVTSAADKIRITGVSATTNTVSVSFPHGTFANVTAYKTWLGSNPIQIVYEMATPEVIQLTPTEVCTLLGNNAISCDTGDINVTYRCDPTILYNAL